MFDDGQVKINLICPDGVPDLIWAEGMKRNVVRRPMQIVTEQRPSFLDRWRQIHG
ncbi:hypothetical protein MIC97_20655 [Aquamicrobium sp. NLF2-7]|uniref:hypothetical protein n=1 Tax=Aquamicrobium sp. NLF2-7 TaxID=2918753 RepID=UPI001EFAF712|nr:hypothetical protein [Aquamicrobium sp. NLF2-7]